MFEDCILFEDEHIIVIHKEPYFPVQSGSSVRPDCVTEIKKLLKERDGIRGEPYTGVIHRLDEPVEGIVVFAKTAKAAAVLSGELAKGGFSKEYTAAVLPVSDDLQREAVLKDHILTDRRANRSAIVPEGTKGAKEAKLGYSTEGELSDRDGRKILLLKVLLYTGRHHQIRVQLANAGMPVAGDRKYGEEKLPLPLCLAETGLSFAHPADGKRMTYSISPGFMEKLKQTGL
ncbi:MAG: RNA pseudouridine synthase [Lachnospiraceae bacterium]|nr:RNA pseudouridine synthase [Lachnospiraceae bacterium]